MKNTLYDWFKYFFMEVNQILFKMDGKPAILMDVDALCVNINVGE